VVATHSTAAGAILVCDLGCRGTTGVTKPDQLDYAPESIVLNARSLPVSIYDRGHHPLRYP
jgi:hypothetical protein